MTKKSIGLAAIVTALVAFAEPAAAKEFLFPEGRCTFETIKETSQCGRVTIKHAGRRNGVMSYRLAYVSGDCKNGRIFNVVYRAKSFKIKGKTIIVDNDFEVKILRWDPKTKKVSVYVRYHPAQGASRSGGGSTFCRSLH